MGLNRIILLLGLIFSFSSFSQERFLKICNNSSEYADIYENDIKWLKYDLKTDDCNVVAEKLSSFMNFNQFMTIGLHASVHHFNWINDFPHLTHRFKARTELFFKNPLGFVPEPGRNIWHNLDLYDEFDNLNVADTEIIHFKDLCNVRKTLPHIDTLIVTKTDLHIINEDCLGIKNIPWLIVKDHQGVGNMPVFSKVIGIIDFIGSVKDVRKFRSLRYLGIENGIENNDMSYLSQNINLTHLSVNLQKGVLNITKLGDMRNLESLTINCNNNYSEYQGMSSLIFKPCDRPYLKDLTFLKNLPWLEKLNLAVNQLEDVSVISSLTRLKSLNLSYNNITVMPDLSQLTELKHFDISHNPVSE